MVSGLIFTNVDVCIKKMKNQEKTPIENGAGASAIILAGGKSSRMKMDKALLPVSGIPLIEKVAGTIESYFDEIIISAQTEKMYEFLPYPVVADSRQGQGPLMGIYSGLKASSNQINFVVACDIPVVDITFIQHLKSFTNDYEIVVPVTGDGLYEPLFAFYHRNLIPRIEALLSQHIRKVIELYPLATVKEVTMENNNWYFNLNTEEDYQRFLNKQKGGMTHPEEKR